jgi:hypothetical protein
MWPGRVEWNGRDRRERDEAVCDKAEAEAEAVQVTVIIIGERASGVPWYRRDAVALGIACGTRVVRPAPAAIAARAVGKARRASWSMMIA